MKIVLIAEGRQTSRKAITNALIRNGYTAVEACDGAEALHLFDGRDIDMLITEATIPKLNGVDLVKEIRKKSRYKSIPVLMLSAENECQNNSDSNEQNMNWITKPFDLESFMKLVHRTIK